MSNEYTEVALGEANIEVNSPFDRKGYTSFDLFTVAHDSDLDELTTSRPFWLSVDDGDNQPAFTDGINYDYVSIEKLVKVNGSSEDWIKWEGGNESPVVKGVHTEVKFREGHTSITTGGCRWDHWGSDGDIVAYRKVKHSVEDGSTDDIATSDEGEYIGSPTPQNVSSVNTGASVSVVINVEVKGKPFELTRDEGYKLYEDLERIFQESIT